MVQVLSTDRTQVISYAVRLSTFRSATCGIPKGSVLGPLHFFLYIRPLEHIIKQHALSCHFPANDTHSHLSFDKSETHYAVTELNNCHADIQSGTAANFLQLNGDTTEVPCIKNP